jgi:hypothetical protein
MFKALIAAMVLVAASGCSDSATQLNFPALPADMADCKIVRLENTVGQHVLIARCPNSVTTTKGGKSTAVITVDGVNYVKESK